MGPLSIKAYICCLTYVPNRVPLLKPKRDRGVVTMSLCRFLVFLRPVGGSRGRDISLSDIGLRHSGGDKWLLQGFFMVVVVRDKIHEGDPCCDPL